MTDTFVADLEYLLACVEARADKFPVPSHMRELVARVRLAALPKGEPAVKPLEWETLPLGSVVARMPYGRYLAYDSGRALLHFDIIPPARVGNDLEAAKAAAQADYEQRIRSALFATPPTGDGRPPAALCEDCPPVGYETDRTRCLPCPRRRPVGDEHK